MKKTELILLVVTVGLGVTFAATRLPGKGRAGPSEALDGAGLTAGGQGAALPGAATLELLVAKRASLTPLPLSLRNPFRPAGDGPPVREVEVGIRVIGIFGDRDGVDERLAALVTGTLVGPQDDRSGLTVIRMTCDKARLDEFLNGRRVRVGDSVDDLAELLEGRRVRQGDTIGGLRVLHVAPRGVVLAYRGERLQIKLYTRGTDPGDSDHDSSGTRPDETTSPTESATSETLLGVH
jgi:hypothetical protein